MASMRSNVFSGGLAGNGQFPSEALPVDDPAHEAGTLQFAQELACGAGVVLGLPVWLSPEKGAQLSGAHEPRGGEVGEGELLGRSQGHFIHGGALGPGTTSPLAMADSRVWRTVMAATSARGSSM